MQPRAWHIDPSLSRIGFSSRLLGPASVRGAFTRCGGRIELDEARIERSSVELTIDLTSVSTGSRASDALLRSPALLDVARHPAASFRSRRVERGGGGLAVHGDISLHGIVRPAVLAVALGPDAAHPDRLRIRAVVRLRRSDYGLGTGFGLLPGDEIELSFDLAAAAETLRAAA